MRIDDAVPPARAARTRGSAAGAGGGGGGGGGRGRPPPAAAPPPPPPPAPFSPERARGRLTRCCSSGGAHAARHGRQDGQRSPAAGRGGAGHGSAPSRRQRGQPTRDRRRAAARGTHAAHHHVAQPARHHARGERGGGGGATAAAAGQRRRHAIPGADGGEDTGRRGGCGRGEWGGKMECGRWRCWAAAATQGSRDRWRSAAAARRGGAGARGRSACAKVANLRAAAGPNRGGANGRGSAVACRGGGRESAGAPHRAKIGSACVRARSAAFRDRALVHPAAHGRHVAGRVSAAAPRRREARKLTWVTREARPPPGTPPRTGAPRHANGVSQCAGWLDEIWGCQWASATPAPRFA
jgi:hypothetical protein